MFETDYSMKKFWAMKEYNYKKQMEKEMDEEIQRITAEKDKEIALLKAQLEEATKQKNH